MTEQEIDLQKANALYRHHLAAQRVAHIKHRAADIASTLRSMADAIINNPDSFVPVEREPHMEALSGMAAVGKVAIVNPLTIETFGVVNVGALTVVAKELREAIASASALEAEARRLGVDPVINHG